MDQIEVKTKEELLKAKDKKFYEIVVVGDLAKNIHEASKIKKLGKKALKLLAVAFPIGLALVPFTGSISAFAVSAIASLSGVSTSIIWAITILGGLAIVKSLFKNYDEVDVQYDAQNTVFKVKLRRKQSKIKEN